MVGQVVSRPIAEVDPDISEGLAKRLVRYATSRLEDFGFSHAVEGWPIEVYTMDADLPPSERYYSVRWNNEKNSGLEICGILTRNGWPFIDHGISIAE